MRATDSGDTQVAGYPLPSVSLSTLDLRFPMWHGIFGHDAVVERFRSTLGRGRLASTYLFVGPAGVGKRQFALKLAEALLCGDTSDESLQPCGQCQSCRLIAAGNHPDLELLGLPADKSSLPVELFIGDAQHRNREGLCHRISLKPYLGRRRVAIIDDADHFNLVSANCLLKTLEEPPPRSLLILIGTSASKQLPTIRSRAQIVRFEPLPPDAIAEIMLANGVVSDRNQAERLAALSEGSLERACQMAEPELGSFREQFLTQLSVGDHSTATKAPATRVSSSKSAVPADGVRLARSVQSFVEEAGKEATLRRKRLRTIVSFAEEFYRGLLRAQAGSQPAGDPLLASAIRKSLDTKCAVPTERVLESLDACFATLECVDRNANLGLVIQKWCEDLTGVSTIRG